MTNFTYDKQVIQLCVKLTFLPNIELHVHWSGKVRLKFWWKRFFILSVWLGHVLWPPIPGACDAALQRVIMSNVANVSIQAARPPLLCNFRCGARVWKVILSHVKFSVTSTVMSHNLPPLFQIILCFVLLLLFDCIPELIKQKLCISQINQNKNAAAIVPFEIKWQFYYVLGMLWLRFLVFTELWNIFYKHRGKCCIFNF